MNHTDYTSFGMLPNFSTMLIKSKSEEIIPSLPPIHQALPFYFDRANDINTFHMTSASPAYLSLFQTKDNFSYNLDICYPKVF